jgi:hypothetical protein
MKKIHIIKVTYNQGNVESSNVRKKIYYHHKARCFLEVVIGH